MGPSAPGEPFSPGGPGGPAGPGSPGRPAGPVSPRGPLPPSFPLGPGGPGRPMFPWAGGEVMPSGSSPGPPRLPAEGQPGVSQCQLGQGGHVEPTGWVPSTSRPTSPPSPAATVQHLLTPPPPRLPTSRPARGTHGGAGGTNSSSSTRETSSTLEGKNTEVTRGRIQASPAPAMEWVQGTVPWLGATTESPRAGSQEESIHPRGSWG